MEGPRRERLCFCYQYLGADGSQMNEMNIVFHYRISLPFTSDLRPNPVIAVAPVPKPLGFSNDLFDLTPVRYHINPEGGKGGRDPTALLARFKRIRRASRVS